MKVILLGAGRGARLMPFTASQPKCFTEVAGARILDWTLRAFRQNGLDRFVFVGGYLMDVVSGRLPESHLCGKSRLVHDQHPRFPRLCS